MARKITRVANNGEDLMNYRYSIKGCINLTLFASLLTVSYLSIGTSVVAQDEVALEVLRSAAHNWNLSGTAWL